MARMNKDRCAVIVCANTAFPSATPPLYKKISEFQMADEPGHPVGEQFWCSPGIFPKSSQKRL